MPRKGQAYPIDDGWRKRVRLALEERGWTQSDLARELKVGRSTVNALLTPTDQGGIQQTPLKPQVHMVFKWTPPIPPSLEEEAGEALELFQQMTPTERARWIERAHAIIEEGKRRK